MERFPSQGKELTPPTVLPPEEMHARSEMPLRDLHSLVAEMRYDGKTRAISDASLRVAKLYRMTRKDAFIAHPEDIIWDTHARTGNSATAQEIRYVETLHYQLQHHMLTEFDAVISRYMAEQTWLTVRAVFEKTTSSFSLLDTDDIDAQLDYIDRYTRKCCGIYMRIGDTLDQSGKEVTFTTYTSRFPAEGSTRVEELLVQDHSTVDPLLLILSDEYTETITGHITRLEPGLRRIIEALINDDDIADLPISPDDMSAARSALLQSMQNDPDLPGPFSRQDTAASSPGLYERWRQLVGNLHISEIFSLLDTLDVRERLAILKNTRYYLPAVSTKAYAESIEMRNTTIFYGDFLHGVQKIENLIADGHIPRLTRTVREICDELDAYRPVFGSNRIANIDGSQVFLATMSHEDKGRVSANLTDAELAIAQYAWDFIHTGRSYKARYSAHEISALTGYSLIYVRQTIKQISQIYHGERRKLISDTGVSIPSHSLRHKIITQRPNIDPFTLAQLTIRERSLLDLFTTTNQEGRYTFHDSDGRKAMHTRQRIYKKIDIIPSNVYDLYHSCSKALLGYETAHLSLFAVALVLKRHIGAGLPCEHALKDIAKTYGLGYKILSDRVKQLSKIGKGHIPEDLFPYSGLHGVTDDLALRYARVGCDFSVYDTFVQTYPELQTGLRQEILRIDRIQETAVPREKANDKKAWLREMYIDPTYYDAYITPPALRILGIDIGEAAL